MIKLQYVCKHNDSLFAPRHNAHRVEIGLHGEVAVTALPRRHLVPINGIHIYIDSHQVIATFSAVGEALVDEKLGVDELALKPPLHICDRQNHGVDLIIGDGFTKCISGQWRVHQSPGMCPVCPDLGMFLAYVVLSALTRRPLL